MIDELADLLNDFPGESNRTRCFGYIFNLVAKSTIKQFDVPKAQADVLNHAAKELAALAFDLDIEEQIARDGQLGEDEGNSDEMRTIASMDGLMSVQSCRRLGWGFGQELSNYVICETHLAIPAFDIKSSFFLDGMPSSMNSSSMNALCREMFLPARTRHMICSNSHSIIA